MVSRELGVASPFLSVLSQTYILMQSTFQVLTVKYESVGQFSDYVLLQQKRKLVLYSVCLTMVAIPYGGISHWRKGDSHLEIMGMAKQIPSNPRNMRLTEVY